MIIQKLLDIFFDSSLERAREVAANDPLIESLRDAIQTWSNYLPAEKRLLVSHSILPQGLAELDGKLPALGDLRAKICVGQLPTASEWLCALFERWHQVRADIRDPAPFFAQSEDWAIAQLEVLSKSLHDCCARDWTRFGNSIYAEISELRERLAELQDMNVPKDPLQVALRRFLPHGSVREDHIKVLVRLSRYQGECFIAAPQGDYECLHMPSTVDWMMWGWERKPASIAGTNKDPGSRSNRLRWILVTEDLEELGLLSKEVEGRIAVYKLTAIGWRLANELQKLAQ